MKFKTFTILAILAAPLPSHAADKVLNGGDACERRFKEVRGDLTSWIQKGGAGALTFAKGQNAEAYAPSMLGWIRDAKVSCTSEKLRVGATEKVCVNETNGRGDARITCQREAFLALSVNEQYRLTHHEYAGLAGFESNAGEASSYVLSDQLTGYLDSYATKRLTVKAKASATDALDRNFQDFYGKYEIVGCAVTTDFPAGSRELNLCDVAVLAIERNNMINSPIASLSAISVWNKKPDMYGSVILGYSSCQLGYGTVDCTPGNYSAEIPMEPTPKIFYSTRIAKAGGTTFLDISIEDTREVTRFEKWSLVLKPYTGPLPPPISGTK